MKIKNKLQFVLVFLQIPILIEYLRESNIVILITLEILFFITLYFLYIINSDEKIVISKKTIQKSYKRANLNNYFVMFIEISNLSTYSQYYNIEIGDNILNQVFKLLRKKIPKNKLFLYRTDQIVVIQEFKSTSIISQSLRSEEQHRSASSLLHYLKRQDYHVNNEEESYDISLKIGVSSQGKRKEEKSLNDLIRLAHFLMIKAKDIDLDIVVVNEELRVIKQDLDSFNKEIMNGLKLDEFSPFFLPIIDSKNMTVIGTESLVRWRKNKYRIVEASKFKDIAIEKQLFEKIDKRVIEKTFAAYKEWKELDLIDDNFKMTINLSFKSLIMILPIELMILVEKYGINPRNVEFDISEDSVHNLEAIDSINRLIELGFKFSLDAFNSKSLSLESLLSIKLDTIKIDKSNLPKGIIDEKQFAFYETIVKFGKIMDLKIMSKGIENKCNLKFVQQLDVDYIQGYYFTPPLDDEKIVVYLNKYRKGILNN